ncbi:DUF2971 domain-containing protein [Clostridium estertheticum]|uniref:DUF2971 domain-containing protein n=1 Tax=Clostridium estertheticum TaxID=238834 RepID=UPI001CF3C567|nr:DUF2971 domain-containing protein [Clostridium estertheticum]MCB2339603.1 DUF2971 domain-containing protein [Clostridium estertheticum]
MDLEKRFNDFEKRTNYSNVGSTKDISNLIDLYHYTSASALKSIIQNKSIYMSKSDFMNDAQEIKYALSIVERITKEHTTLTEELKNKICDQLIDLRKDYFFGNIFILSFSKEPDSLALWSNYGREDGYNIKFTKEFFHDVFSAQPKFVTLPNKARSYGCSFKVNEVIYDESIQIKIITELLNEIDFYDKNIKEKNSREYINIIVNYIIDHVAFFKNPGHKPEMEYRLIVTFEGENYKQSILNHRIFKGAFIPYVEYQINLNIIKQITIGPTNNFELVKRGLKSYVESNPNFKPDIEESEMILRF